MRLTQVLLILSTLSLVLANTQEAPTPIIKFHYIATVAVILLTILLGLLTTGAFLPPRLKRNATFDVLFHRRLLPTTNNKFLRFIGYNQVAEMTLGEVYIVFTYLALCFTWFTYGYLQAIRLVKTNPTGRAFAWMALFNISFVILPATRYSLWFKIFGTSFERAIKYHKMIGAWNLIGVIVHGIIFIRSATINGKFINIITWKTDYNNAISILPGFIAGILFIVAALVSVEFVRRRFWKFFVVAHVALNVSAVALVVIHAIWWQAIPFLAISATLYIIDLALRATIGATIPSKIVSAHYDPTVKVTKLTVHKSSFKYEPGQYVFLYIGRVGMINAQPFSIAEHQSDINYGQDDVTFYIKNMGKGSWTDRLSVLAQDIEKGTVAPHQVFVRMEGPYGHVSHPYQEYDTILLVAGGIGITPIYSLYNSLLQSNRVHGQKAKHIHLIWINKESDIWSMFPDAFKYDQLDGCSNSVVDLYITGKDATPIKTNNATVHYGRPDFNQILKEVIVRRQMDRVNDGTPYVSVLGCGPETMLNQLESACWKESGSLAKFHFHREVFEL